MRLWNARSALRPDGVLLMGVKLGPSNAETSNLIAVQTRSPGLDRSAWPKVGFDNRNSSKQSQP
jgi:hypothetical protein